MPGVGNELEMLGVRVEELLGSTKELLLAQRAIFYKSDLHREHRLEGRQAPHQRGRCTQELLNR